MAVSPASSVTPQKTSKQWLRTASVVAMVVPLIMAVTERSLMPFATRVEGAFVWFLCLLPSWWYLRTPLALRRPIPFMPLMGLLYGAYYALPAALGSYNQHYRIILEPRRDYDDAVFLAMQGWWALLIGYLTTKYVLPPRKATIPIIIPDDRRYRYGAALMMTGLLFEALRRLAPVPLEAAALLAFIGNLGWFGSGLLIVMLVQGRLPFLFRLLTYGGVFAFFALAVGSGSVANAALYVTVLAMAAWIGSGHLKPTWVAAIVCGGALIVSLRGVADQYRKLAWMGQQITLVGRTQLFLDLLHQRVDAYGVPETVRMGFESSASRSANLDLFADVIRRTPSEIPYWGGETYLTLVGAFIPRFLWPDKPTKELGQAFGHRYSYIGARDEGTAINLPILVEFYANFGSIGVLVGMMIVGMLYFFVQWIFNAVGQDSVVSLAGVVIMIPLMNIESDFSLGFGGLVMNGVALAVLLGSFRRSAARYRLRGATMLTEAHALASSRVSV